MLFKTAVGARDNTLVIKTLSFTEVLRETSFGTKEKTCSVLIQCLIVEQGKTNPR